MEEEYTMNTVFIEIPLSDEKLNKYIYGDPTDFENSFFIIDYKKCKYKNDALFLYLFNLGIKNTEIINITEDELKDLGKYYIRSNRSTSIQSLNEYILKNIAIYEDLYSVIYSLYDYMNKKLSGNIDREKYKDELPPSIGLNIISIITSDYFWDCITDFKPNTYEVKYYNAFTERIFGGFSIDYYLNKSINPYSILLNMIE